MLRRLVLLLALAACSPACAVDVPLELAQHCAALERGSKGRGDALQIPDARGPLLCWGYMQAIQDLAALADLEGRKVLGFCPPPESRLTDLIHAFLESAHSRRSEPGANTAVAVIKALQAAYPCARGKD